MKVADRELRASPGYTESRSRKGIEDGRQKGREGGRNLQDKLVKSEVVKL